MSNVKADRLLQFLRMEYRAIVVQEVDVNWRCPSWTAQTACSEGVEPTPALCAACPVKAECLVTALVVDDPAPIRGGLTREDRTAAFLAIEQDAFHLDDWLRERAQELRMVS
ncbi:WhiB family transcriptional regulator [Micropruina sonneratiae]|jgi:hypothetical protein|uniref:WhiB family transcriptional regulator n=1 Tax=Micropruina sonneratiae TaxID=2986940 RepID=UPI002225CE72|nr:WhiB family transcriptional regulator [Micropruina sp. KQZ13P-5]MCW3157920.1 WhiB family transcriptional regulator [Micropruina sp. KQZ13P-5]HOQ52428.1 WhiB family transcriptional regulator [Micropruina sp.]